MVRTLSQPTDRELCAHMAWRGCLNRSNMYWLTTPLLSCHFYFCKKYFQVCSKEASQGFGPVTRARPESKEEESGPCPSFMKPVHRAEPHLRLPPILPSCSTSSSFTPPVLHQYLRTSSSFVPPLSSGVSFPPRLSPLLTLCLLVSLLHWGECTVASLVALTLSQLDQTTWTTHILSSFMSLLWIN